ncbi:MAG: FeoB-associated Cys-rich membrane protein [Schwartzia sp.]|nr:FeoB-associated Cys-rich membrane protein [Schwartzia sp. (in: firmicutes)]
MLQFIWENIGNIVVCFILLLLVGLALRTVVLNRRKGKSSCGCDCSSCHYQCGKGK